jgi:hypothetical protein
MSIKIYSIEGNVEYDATVVKKNDDSDWRLLETGVDLCEEPIKGPHRRWPWIYSVWAFCNYSTRLSLHPKLLLVRPV